MARDAAIANMRSKRESGKNGKLPQNYQSNWVGKLKDQFPWITDNVLGCFQSRAAEKEETKGSNPTSTCRKHGACIIPKTVRVHSSINVSAHAAKRNAAVEF